jgi:hypothetical protein
MAAAHPPMTKTKMPTRENRKKSLGVPNQGDQPSTAAVP